MKHKGFTLVELVVVIIIVVTVAMLIVGALHRGGAIHAIPQ